jgi:hypothetical protein
MSACRWMPPNVSPTCRRSCPRRGAPEQSSSVSKKNQLIDSTVFNRRRHATWQFACAGGASHCSAAATAVSESSLGSSSNVSRELRSQSENLSSSVVANFTYHGYDGGSSRAQSQVCFLTPRVPPPSRNTSFTNEPKALRFVSSHV